MTCCVRTGGRGKHNFIIGGTFRKAKYEIRRWRKNRSRKARAGKKFPSSCSVDLFLHTNLLNILNQIGNISYYCKILLENNITTIRQ